MAATTKISDLARVIEIRVTDWPTPLDIVELELLGTGQRLEWRANSLDMETAQRVAPFHVGSELALEAHATDGGTLRRVRYACNGKSFRGATAHNKKAA